MASENRPKTPPRYSTAGQTPLGNITNLPFPTPRRRKTPKTRQPPKPNKNVGDPVACLWPRFKKQIPVEEVISVAEKIFGYTPKPWQVDLFKQIAEGQDTMAIAGTGMGKSLPLALLAIAAELTGTPGTVMVICPLKSLEMDQMARFNLTEIEREDGTKVKVTAVAINEDNKDNSTFVKLRQGAYRICYASPECLLRNNSFKKLFRREEFRRRIITLAVDEAHVIQDWKDDFRKDYDELSTLKVIAGSEIPWTALTATCATSTFITIFNSLGLGRNREFWGIDMGADRPNLAQWVRKMEYSKKSMSDILAFVPLPDEIQEPSDLTKSVFYFKTRGEARRAMRKCRRLLPAKYRDLVAVYTATNSEPHKEDVIAAFKANKVRWVFATLALGMGLDVPDIERAVIFGVCALSEMYQKGGRAARDQTMKGVMVWIVEEWAFEG